MRIVTPPLACAVLLLAVIPAGAHVPMVRGRLIDLVAHSDVIVIATVERREPMGRGTGTLVRVDDVLAGGIREKELVLWTMVPSSLGGRYVFFLRRAGDRLESVQPRGTVFAAEPEDAGAYRRTVGSIARALRADEASRPARLRAALIPALSAAPPPLRYHAALDLAALAHESGPWPAGERAEVERIASDPTLDPALRPLLTEALRLGGVRDQGAR